MGVGAIVRVDAPGRVVFGVVMDAAAYDETRLYTAAVLRQDPEEPLQPVPLGEVRMATDADVRMALRMDGYTGGDRGTGIPVGTYGSAGLAAPVYLDADFLLGPEAAHLNITGVSGLATKTSAVEFFLTSIFQTFPAHKGSVAALCFNVKGPDLCFLDQPAELSAEDLASYARLGLSPKPFDNVRYYAPCKPDGVNLNTLRTHPDLAANTEPLTWGLREVLEYAEVVLNRDDLDAKADAFIDFLADRVVGPRLPRAGTAPAGVAGADLRRSRGVLPRHLRLAGEQQSRRRLADAPHRHDPEGPEPARQHHHPGQGAGDRRRRLERPPLGRLRGPLACTWWTWRAWIRWRRTSSSRAWSASSASTSSAGTSAWTTWSCSWTSSTSTRPPTAPTPTCGRCCWTCRSAAGTSGWCLFSAQQFRSQVLRRVVGNAGTTIYGRMDPDELATAGYATLSPATKIKLATLPKGELMVRHPHFTQPVFIRFPRPCVLSGREGVERFPPAPDLPFDEAVARQLRSMDPSIGDRPGPRHRGRAAGGRRAPGAGPHPAAAPRRRPGLLHGGAGPADRAGARHPEDRGDPAPGHHRSVFLLGRRSCAPCPPPPGGAFSYL